MVMMASSHTSIIATERALSSLDSIVTAGGASHRRSGRKVPFDSAQLKIGIGPDVASNASRQRPDPGCPDDVHGPKVLSVEAPPSASRRQRQNVNYTTAQRFAAMHMVDCNHTWSRTYRTRFHDRCV